MTTRRHHRYKGTLGPSKRNRAIVAAYRSGQSLAEVGDQFGLSRERIRQILVEAGHAQRHGGALIRDRNKAAFDAFDAKWGDRLFREATRLSSISGAVTRLGLDDVNIGWVRRSIATRSQVRGLRSFRNAPGPVYTDEQMLAALRRHARHGHIGGPQYTAARNPATEPSVPLFIKRFGSWSHACDLAGLKPLHTGGNRGRRWSRADVVAAVTAYYEHCLAAGTTMTVRGYEDWRATQRRALPSEGTVRSYGTWSELWAKVSQGKLR